MPEIISRCAAVCTSLSRRLTRLPIKSSVSLVFQGAGGSGRTDLASRDDPASEKGLLRAAKAAYPTTWPLLIAERQHGRSIQGQSRDCDWRCLWNRTCPL